MTFEECMAVIFKWEGGYINLKNDPGGETNFGISKRAFPNLDIKNLTKKHAEFIYKQEYYNKIHGEVLPKEIRLVVLNAAVNQGVSQAVKFLQRSVGAKMDGILGPNTMKKIAECDPKKLKYEFLKHQVDHYFSLNKSDFIKGWIQRLVDISQY